MYPVQGCRQVLIRGIFPKGRQNSEEMHPAAVANRADIVNFSCKRFVAGLPIEELWLLICGRGLKDLTTK